MENQNDIGILDTSQIKVLDALEKHIIAQEEKAKNLKKGEFIEVKFDKLQSLIDEIDGK